MSQILIRALQDQLKELDFKPGVSDGVFGKQTFSAVHDALGELVEYRRGERGGPAVPKRGEPARLGGIDLSWMPPSDQMKRIINHWTGGSYAASSLDKEHYHFLIEGDGAIVLGEHPVTANERVAGKTTDDYAAHTLNCNSGSIGVSMCSMGGAVERPYSPGRWPYTKDQFDAMVHLNAVLCIRYSIPVSPKTVLSHAEVQDNLKIKQRGKWDISVLPNGSPLYHNAQKIGDIFRARVETRILELKNGKDPDETDD